MSNLGLVKSVAAEKVMHGVQRLAHLDIMCEFRLKFGRRTSRVDVSILLLQCLGALC